MIKAGIIGSTGYAGGELARLLLQRDDVEIKWYGSRSYIDQKYASIYQNMFKIVDDKCMDDNMKELADQVDVIFTATPQGLCSTLVNEEILSKVKIIDLSADFRIKDVAVYEKWYKLTHGSPEYIKEAVYGLPEVPDLASMIIVFGSISPSFTNGYVDKKEQVGKHPGFAHGVLK